MGQNSQYPPSGPPPSAGGPPGAGTSGPPGGGGPRRNRLPILIGAGVVVIVALAIATFLLTRSDTPDVATADGELANAEEFLTDVREGWRSELPSDNVRVSDDPRCYYVLDADSDEVTGVIACGGVRRFDSESGEVWDTFEYDVSESSEGQQRAGSAEPAQTSVSRPDGVLVTATGDEAPDGIDDLAAPELPSAEPGLVLSGDEIDVGQLDLTDVKHPGDKGRVITPGGTFTVDSVATAPHVVESASTSEAEDTTPEQPADGELFRVVTFSFEAPEEVSEENSTAVEPTVMVETGDQQIGLGEPEDFEFTGGDKFSALVSVPESADASMVVASAGHEQRVDLATGERKPDPVTDAYYRDVVEQSLGKTTNYPQQSAPTSDGPEKGSYSLEIESAEITPYAYDGNLGYAAKGKVWLVATYSGEFSSKYLMEDATGWDWTATVKNKTISSHRIAERTWDKMVVIFEAPADLTSAKITAKTNVTVQPIQDGPKSTMTFGPTSVKAEFPN